MDPVVENDIRVSHTAPHSVNKDQIYKEINNEDEELFRAMPFFTTR